MQLLMSLTCVSLPKTPGPVFSTFLSSPLKFLLVKVDGRPPVLVLVLLQVSSCLKEVFVSTVANIMLRIGDCTEEKSESNLLASSER